MTSILEKFTAVRLSVVYTLLVMTAQIVLSAIFIGGYFVILWAFITGRVQPPPEYKEMVIALLGVLTAGVGMILAYWFQRQRPQLPSEGAT